MQFKRKGLACSFGRAGRSEWSQYECLYRGRGDKTLVFMSGGGTCSPILDFKSLYSLLSSEYKIAVVEKFGYGFSDIVDEKEI